MYFWLKLLHILPVVTFLGGIVSGLFWHAFSMRTRDAQLIAHTVEGIIRNDRVLIGPSAILIIIAGIAVAIKGGFAVLATGWILWTLILFVAGALITMACIAPLQRQMLEFARAPASFDYVAYDALAHRWRMWVVLAVLASFTGVALMVLKPAF